MLVKRNKVKAHGSQWLLLVLVSLSSFYAQASDKTLTIEYSGYRIPIAVPSIGQIDRCPNTPFGQVEDSNGCSLSQLDSDIDGVSDADDLCANSLVGTEPPTVDSNGCSAAQVAILNTFDEDSDGVPDYLDDCDDTSVSQIPGIDSAGCHPDQRDADEDGLPDYQDAYPLQNNFQCPAN